VSKALVMSNFKSVVNVLELCNLQAVPLTIIKLSLRQRPDLSDAAVILQKAPRSFPDNPRTPRLPRSKTSTAPIKKKNIHRDQIPRAPPPASPLPRRRRALAVDHADAASAAHLLFPVHSHAGVASATGSPSIGEP
jgi:hypothetical protein